MSSCIPQTNLSVVGLLFVFDWTVSLYYFFMNPTDLFFRWCIWVLRTPPKEVKWFCVEFLYSTETVGVICVLVAVLIIYVKLISNINPLASWEIPPVINSQLSWLKWSKPEIPNPQTTPASPTVYAGKSTLLFFWWDI